MRNFFIVGHRGMGPTSTLPEDAFLPDVPPENSLAAMKKAFQLGADGVEFDVHVTKDRKIAVIHDECLNKKIYKANRTDTDLGLVSEHTLQDLAQYDIGHGHKIPSLKDVLELIVSENKNRRAEGKQNLIINIELKGHDVVDTTYLEISEYINTGKLNTSDFIFNSFDWEKLEDLKSLEPEFKVVPAIRTVNLFGKDSVQMPNFKVADDCPYHPEALNALQKFHDKVDCYAFDCIVFDLRPDFIDFCEKNKIGLFTSTSKEAVKADRVKTPLALMLEASNRLPMVCFRADNTTETLDILNSIKNSQENKPTRPPVQKAKPRNQFKP